MNLEWIEFETATITSYYVLRDHLSYEHFISSVADKTNAHTPQKRTILLFFFNSKRFRDCSQATILKRLLSNNRFLVIYLYLMIVVIHSKQRMAITP